MQASLPLFEDPPVDAAPAPRCPTRQRTSDPHLSAARRLARDIRRTPQGSPEQTRTGRKICRHLLAMLQQETPAADSNR